MVMIMLNIKRLRIKMPPNKPQIMTLKAKGVKVSPPKISRPKRNWKS